MMYAQIFMMCIILLYYSIKSSFASEINNKTTNVSKTKLGQSESGKSQSGYNFNH